MTVIVFLEYVGVITFFLKIGGIDTSKCIDYILVSGLVLCIIERHDYETIRNRFK